jgi:hypothetical protein
VRLPAVIDWSRMHRPARFRPLLLACLAALACPGERTELLAHAGAGADSIRIVLRHQTRRSGSNHGDDRDLAYAIEVRSPRQIAVRRGDEPWQVFVRDGDRPGPSTEK